MASSMNGDQSQPNETFGMIAANELQNFLKDDSKSSSEPTELTNSLPKSDNSIDNMVISGNNDNVENIITSGACPPSHLQRISNGLIETFDSLEGHFLSACNNIHTPITSDNGNLVADDDTHPTSPIPLSTGEQPIQDQVAAQGLAKTIENSKTPTTPERHIMISYNYDSSFEICQKICNKLKKLGYKVWMDEDDLHGVILEGMARGIENSYTVLICYNEKYSKSGYCKLEATYTFEKHVEFIPCRLQASYVPDGWLGIVISDRLYIDFSPPNDFDETFKRLIDEVEHVKNQTKICSNQVALPSVNDKNRNPQMNNEIMRDRFKTIIHQYKESIHKGDYDLRLLEKEELCRLITHLQERLFDDTLLISNKDNKNVVQPTLNDNELLHNLLEQARTQTELLRKILEILMHLTDPKTIIRLSFTFLFIWTVKTHVIDVCFRDI